MNGVQLLQDEFDGAIAYLPEVLRQALKKISKEDKANIQEIRMRADRPLSVFCGVSSHFPGWNGELDARRENWITVDRELLQKAFVQLCDYSVHTHAQEMSRGFITTPKGDRVGICASVIRDNDGKMVCRDVSSLNLRVAREIRGAGRELVQRVPVLEGVILAGAPGTGKTTILRDLGRGMASGELGRCRKVVFVDERYELSAMSQGSPMRDIGLCGDAICGLAKAAALEQAVRTLSPEMIICDEIGSLEEVKEISGGLCCGVTFLVSVHCGSHREAFSSPILEALMGTGAFGTIVLLDTPERPSKIREIIGREEYNHGKGGRIAVAF